MLMSHGCSIPNKNNNMNRRPTPETDAFILSKDEFGVTDYEWREHSRRLERERDEAREERDKLKQLLAADSENVDAYLGVCTERDDLLIELEEYRSIAESIGAKKAVSEKEKAIQERDELRDILQKLIGIIPELECNDFSHKKEEQHSLFEKCPVLDRYNVTIKQAESLLKTTK